MRLSDDNLSLAGPVEHVYDPWRYPSDWIVEGFAPEGPKIHQVGDWYYMITAIGGTGPPTGHMVIAARSRSTHGSWERQPGNPLVRTTSIDEAWWSRGHASLVQALDESWWSLYHGYENGFWTLGRQCLMGPVSFTPDGWFEMTGGDLSQPIPNPLGGEAQPHGKSLSGDFSGPFALGSKWTFFRPAPDEAALIRMGEGALFFAGKGEALLGLAAAADGSRSQLHVRVGHRMRARRQGGPDPALRRQALSRPWLRGGGLRNPSIRDRARPPRQSARALDADARDK